MKGEFIERVKTMECIDENLKASLLRILREMGDEDFNFIELLDFILVEHYDAKMELTNHFSGVIYGNMRNLEHYEQWSTLKNIHEASFNAVIRILDKKSNNEYCALSAILTESHKLEQEFSRLSIAQKRHLIEMANSNDE